MGKTIERAADVPVTQKMLFAVRDQLKSEISAMGERIDKRFEKTDAVIHDLKAEMHGMKSDNHGLRSEIHGMKSDMHEMKSEIHGMKSEIHGLRGEMHRVALLVEEQNAKNNIVLDGLTSLFQRQERVETEVKSLRSLILEANR